MLKTIALQKASDEAKNNLEQKLQMYISNIESLQEELKNSSSDIEKSEHVIFFLNIQIIDCIFR
jgi:CHASE1-domain containing sensor protein